MVSALAQSTSVFRSATANPTLAFAKPLGAGNLAVATLNPFQRTTSSASWSVGGSSAPALAGKDDTTDTNNPLYCYYTKNTSAGAHTVQWTMTSGDAWLTVNEYTGIDTVSPLGPTTSAGGSGTAMDSGTTSALTERGALVFGQFWHETVSGNTVTASATPVGFTVRQSNVNNSASQAGTIEDGRVVALSGVAAKATVDVSVTGWLALVVVFYEQTDDRLHQDAATWGFPHPPVRTS